MKRLFVTGLLFGFMAVAPLFHAVADDNQCRNLFDISNARTLYRNGSVVETKTTTGYSLTGSYTSANFIIVHFGTVAELEGKKFKISYKHTPYQGSNISLIYTQADGSERSESIGSNPVSSANAGNRTNVSLKILTPDTTGSHVFVFDDIQIEEGSTATEYTPYNPLCATCDGQIENYVSATGTVAQNGKPSPTNPIEPVFYKQGDMVLRKVGNYADSYDANTGKITRRVGVKVFNGTENWANQSETRYYLNLADCLRDAGEFSVLSSHFKGISTSTGWASVRPGQVKKGLHDNTFAFNLENCLTVQDFKQYLAAQYAAGTPVAVYYPLATETTENWNETTYCAPNIKIATTAYNAARFSPVKTDLDSAVATIREIVTKTINQTAAIASLQADKQTRPEDACPAGKKCLLVETEENGVIVPHWFPIIEAPEDN